jgi:hypothetical protein
MPDKGMGKWEESPAEERIGVQSPRRKWTTEEK